MDIPNNLDEALVELESQLTQEDRALLTSCKEEDMGQHHFFAGMGMRNNWGLWHGSVLAKWFNEQGIYHADDMSGIILDSFWRKLNNVPIDLEEQVKFYQDYWRGKGY